MSIPGFTAEASLHTLGEPYRGTGAQPHGAQQTGVVPQCQRICDWQGCYIVCGRHALE
jgi:hypothetical protein